jgi:hypothetical protein
MIKLLLSVTLVAGCASMHVHSDTALGTDLRRYRTYTWLEPVNRTEPVTIVDQQIRAALRTQLAARGFREDAARPDFLVGYHVLEERKVAVTDWGNGLYGWGSETMPYNEGTLMVSFIDAGSNQVIWHASASGAVEHPGMIDVKRLQKATTAMLAQYPIRM